VCSRKEHVHEALTDTVLETSLCQPLVLAGLLVTADRIDCLDRGGGAMKHGSGCPFIAGIVLLIIGLSLLFAPHQIATTVQWIMQVAH
jgi:uncharacterized membrane protein HdeD (DUF308 family)